MHSLLFFSSFNCVRFMQQQQLFFEGVAYAITYRFFKRVRSGKRFREPMFYVLGCKCTSSMIYVPTIIPGFSISVNNKFFVCSTKIACHQSVPIKRGLASQILGVRGTCRLNKRDRLLIMSVDIHIKCLWSP